MESGSPRNRRRGWTLALLTLLYFFYLLDRNAIIVTQELIKRDFDLSDTELGFLLGTVYGISYALAALPMGWLVDRVNRRNLLVAILSVWSALTAACGFSNAYWQLVAIRIGVAASEAGGAPASLSILSGLFPPHRRATAASIFYTGSGLGLSFSFLVGGLAAAELGWRAVFVLFGLPGLLLALLIALTVKEPPRPAEAAAAPGGNTVVADALGLLTAPVLRLVYIGATLYCLSTAAVLGWITAFLMRTHAIDVGHAGALIAASVGGGSIVGGVMIGLAADRAARRTPGGALYVVAAAAILNLVGGLVALWASSLWVATLGMIPFGLTVFAYSGPTNAVISQIAPGRRLGLAFALFTLAANLLGGGLGPVLAGMVSDAWPQRGDLAPALSILLAANILAAIVYVRAGRSMGRHGTRAPG